MTLQDSSEGMTKLAQDLLKSVTIGRPSFNGTICKELGHNYDYLLVGKAKRGTSFASDKPDLRKKFVGSIEDNFRKFIESAGTDVDGAIQRYELSPVLIKILEHMKENPSSAGELVPLLQEALQIGMQSAMMDNDAYKKTLQQCSKTIPSKHDLFVKKTSENRMEELLNIFLSLKFMNFYLQETFGKITSQ